MSPGTQAEQAFEDRVEYELLRRGWGTATGTYDAELGIDTGALWEFIGKTQFEPWRELLELYGGDQDTVMRQFALRVASEIDSRGVLDVLRQGVEDRGVQMDLAYFRPGPPSPPAHWKSTTRTSSVSRGSFTSVTAIPVSPSTLRCSLTGCPSPLSSWRTLAPDRTPGTPSPSTGSATPTTCFSLGAPSCTSPSIRTARSSPRG